MAVFSGFLVYTFLEPLFVPIGSEFAMVFLNILTLCGLSVGMSLGVLLPSIVSGTVLGGAMALLFSAMLAIPNPIFFPSLACTLSCLIGFASSQ